MTFTGVPEVGGVTGFDRITEEKNTIDLPRVLQYIIKTYDMFGKRLGVGTRK